MEHIRASLTTKPDAPLKGFTHLQVASRNACEHTSINKHVECRVNRKELSNILMKGIASLTDEDVYTLSTILGPSRMLVSDPAH